MPDGGTPCAGFAEVYAEVEKLTGEVARLRDARKADTHLIASGVATIAALKAALRATCDALEKTHGGDYPELFDDGNPDGCEVCAAYQNARALLEMSRRDTLSADEAAEVEAVAANWRDRT